MFEKYICQKMQQYCGIHCILRTPIMKYVDKITFI